MTNPPELIDKKALSLRRARARKRPALFLHETIADEVLERLTEVNRRFTLPAVVTGFPEIWAPRLPEARLVTDDEVLTLEPQAHDLVVHALALHLSNDPVGQLVQCRRALKEDGLLICALFAGQTLAELRAAVSATEIQLRGGLSPRMLPLGDIRDLGGLLQRAGFALPVADSSTLNVTYRSLDGLLADLRGMGETNALAQRDRRILGRTFRDVLEKTYLDQSATVEGLLPATFEVVFLSGWAPSDSQPKPLRPGSAAQRLADALGTTELGSGGPVPRIQIRPDD